MNILVTGGAGYIGSVLTEKLVTEGHNIIVLDSLKQGHLGAVMPEATFFQADLADQEAIDKVFTQHRVESVMHLAADSLVADSVRHPDRFFHNNVACGLNLLDAIVKHGVRELVFSSSAAVYGEPTETPISETATLRPKNAYGETKATFERILHWYWSAYQLKYVSLRYFNVAGASERFGEAHYPETHLIPNLLRVAMGKQEQIMIYGTDYNTRDGSCIRDYVHVLDIARAHTQALSWLGDSPVPGIFNLGSGDGYSVVELVNTVIRVTGRDIPVMVCPRRRGDPERLVASTDRAKLEMGWSPDHNDLKSMIESAWGWYQKHPNGYYPTAHL